MKATVRDICDLIETAVRDLKYPTNDLFVIPSAGCYEIYEDNKLIASISDLKIEANLNSAAKFVRLIKDKLGLA